MLILFADIIKTAATTTAEYDTCAFWIVSPSYTPQMGKQLRTWAWNVGNLNLNLSYYEEVLITAQEHASQDWEKRSSASLNFNNGRLSEFPPKSQTIFTFQNKCVLSNTHLFMFSSFTGHNSSLSFSASCFYLATSYMKSLAGFPKFHFLSDCNILFQWARYRWNPSSDPNILSTILDFSRRNLICTLGMFPKLLIIFVLKVNWVI